MQSPTLARSFFILLLVFSLVSFVQANELPRYTLGGDVLHGGSVDLAKAGGDTINLMAARHDPTNGPGEPSYYGDFEDAEGDPAWNGWTHYDVTAPPAGARTLRAVTAIVGPNSSSFVRPYPIPGSARW